MYFLLLTRKYKFYRWHCLYEIKLLVEDRLWNRTLFKGYKPQSLDLFLPMEVSRNNNTHLYSGQRTEIDKFFKNWCNKIYQPGNYTGYSFPWYIQHDYRCWDCSMTHGLWRTRAQLRCSRFSLEIDRQFDFGCRGLIIPILNFNKTCRTKI